MRADSAALERLGVRMSSHMGVMTGVWTTWCKIPHVSATQWCTIGDWVQPMAGHALYCVAIMYRAWNNICTCKANSGGIYLISPENGLTMNHDGQHHGVRPMC